MKRLIAIAVACLIAVGCASVQRTLQLKTELSVMPATQEAAQKELAFLDARIKTCDAWVEAGPVIQDMLKLDEKQYDQIMDEAKDSLAFLKNRRDSVNALLPTLPHAEPSE